jgi:predicted DNA-binding ribbon-helix-helix protein
VAVDRESDDQSPRAGAYLVCRNLVVSGHRTSVRLEKEMWAALNDVAERKGYTVNDLASRIFHRRKKSGQGGLSQLVVRAMAPMTRQDPKPIQTQDSEGVQTKQSDVDRIADPIAAGLRKMGRRSIPRRGRAMDSPRSEIEEIVRDAERSEQLTRRGVGPAQFHEEMARHNLAYRSYRDNQAAGAAYAEECRQLGLKMQNQALPRELRQRDSCRSQRAASSDERQLDSAAALAEDFVARAKTAGEKARGIERRHNG